MAKAAWAGRALVLADARPEFSGRQVLLGPIPPWELTRMCAAQQTAVWFCSINGIERGPLTAEGLKALAATGELREDHLVWKQGDPRRLQASAVRGLFEQGGPRGEGEWDRTPVAPPAVAAFRDVFISYSSRDKTTADAICAGLENDQLRCWIAPRDILPGRNFGEAVIEGIHHSRVMVVVLSNASNGSPHVLREVERAVSRGRPIIPFRIESVEMSAGMEYFLSTPHWLDALTPPLAAHIKTLSATVRAVVKQYPPPLDATSPTPPTALPPPRPANSGLTAAGAGVIRDGLLDAPVWWRTVMSPQGLVAAGMLFIVLASLSVLYLASHRRSPTTAPPEVHPKAGNLAIASVVETGESMPDEFDVVSDLQAGSTTKLPAAAELVEIELSSAMDENKKIEEGLGQPCPFELVETPLYDFISFLADVLGIEFRFDSQALQDVGISEDQPMTAKVKGLPLRLALRTALHGTGMTYAIRDGYLIITTEEGAATFLRTKLYSVDEVLGDSPTDKEIEDFIELIESTVSPESWNEVGGAGSIACRMLHNKRFLAISQTEIAHEDISAFLAKLRGNR